MTYRNYIQEHIRRLSDLFDEASPLRDAATLEEKLVWNKYRQRLNDCMSLLSRFDNRLEDNRAQMELDAWQQKNLYTSFNSSLRIRES